MAKKAKGKQFGGKVNANAKSQGGGARNYGYLKLPENINVFNAPPGDTVNMDFIPYEVSDPKHLDRNEELDIATPGEQWYKKPFYTHRKIGAGDDAVICLRTIGKKCPICEEHSRLEKEGADESEIKALKSSFRVLYCIRPKDGVEKNAGELHLWDMSNYLFQKVLNEELEENEEFGDFPDTEDGYTVKVRFSEETFAGNKFAKTSRIDFKTRKKAIPEKLLKNVPNLDEVLVIHSYDKLEKMLFEEPDDEDDSANEKPEKKKGKKEKKPKASEGKRTKKSAKPAKESKGKGKGKGDGKCPEGYTYGKDTSKYDDCDDCPLFKKCHKQYLKNNE